MPYAIGVDTGGTFTDAVLIEQPCGRVIASAKALTTHTDLAIGIREAISSILREQNLPIGMVSLSTTLATNAIVEDKGARVAALLIGYSNRVPAELDMAYELGTDHVVFVDGGHCVDGTEYEILDESAIADAARRLAGQVDAFAVSGFFGTRNPEHEIRARDILRRYADLPVTCGHELTHELDATRRAATVALNARLIPLLCSLVDAVTQCLQVHGIEAPLMVVQGDGSLIASDVALERPVETILSGPAASLVGAAHLSGSTDLLVADMGGTTTDIAVLRKGLPRVTEMGATVGRWRTMVRAVDAHTVGIGGDSRVYWGESSELMVGPQRVVPVSLLATQQSGVVETIAELARDDQTGCEPYTWEWLILARPQRMPDDGVWGELKKRLKERALPMSQVYELLVHPGLYARQLGKMEAEGVLQRVGLTATDAAHVLGILDIYDASAAQVAAKAMAGTLGSEKELCERVMEQTCNLVAQRIALKSLAEDGVCDESPNPFGGLLAHAVSTNGDGTLGVDLCLHQPLVAVGAPAHTFFEGVARRLNAHLVIPAHAGVANAVGAVVGSVVQVSRALIVPDELSGDVRVHLASSVKRCADLEEAQELACELTSQEARAMASRAGAPQARVSVSVDQRTAPVGKTPGAIALLEIVVEATAVGRPLMLT